MLASDYRCIAREKLAGNWGVCIVAALVASMLGGAVTPIVSFVVTDVDIDQISRLLDWSPLISKLITAWTLITLILGGAVNVGYCRFLLNQQDEQELKFSVIFSGFKQFATAICSRLLVLLYCLLWSMLFLIPGIVAAYSYAMVPFILAEHPEFSASQALQASKQMLDGHKSELFWLDLSFTGWLILSALSLNIGKLFLNPYTGAAHAAFYRHLTQTERTTL